MRIEQAFSVPFAYDVVFSRDALTVTLLRGIGEAVEVNEMDAALVEESVAWMRARAAAGS